MNTTFSSPLSSLTATPTSLPVDITNLENTYLNLDDNPSGHMDVQLDDITGERVATGLMTGNVTPEIVPIQLRQRARRGQTAETQHWIENRQPFVENWINQRPVFHDHRPPNLSQTNGVWTPTMPPMAFLREYGESTDDDGDSHMQDLVVTPVRLAAALPNSENHGEQEDSATVAIDSVATPVGLATPLPNGKNQGEQQSPAVVTVSTPVRLSTPPPDETDDEDSVVELGTIPACPLAPSPGCDNTDGNQDPVAKGVEHGRCPYTPPRFCQGSSKSGGKAELAMESTNPSGLLPPFQQELSALSLSLENFTIAKELGPQTPLTVFPAQGTTTRGLSTEDLEALYLNLDSPRPVNAGSSYTSLVDSMKTALKLQNVLSPESAKSTGRGVSRTPFGRNLELFDGESPTGRTEPPFEFDNSLEIEEFDLGQSKRSSPDSTFNKQSLSNAGTPDAPFSFDQTLAAEEFEIGTSNPGSPEAPFDFDQSIAAGEFDIGSSNAGTPDAPFEFDQTLDAEEFDVGISNPGSPQAPFNFDQSIPAEEFDIGPSNPGTPAAPFHFDETLPAEFDVGTGTSNPGSPEAPFHFDESIGVEEFDLGPSNPGTPAAEVKHGIDPSFRRLANTGSPEPFDTQDFEVPRSDDGSAGRRMSVSPSPERGASVEESSLDRYLRLRAQLFSLTQLEGLVSRELNAIAAVEKRIEEAMLAGVKDEE